MMNIYTETGKGMFTIINFKKIFIFSHFLINNLDASFVYNKRKHRKGVKTYDKQNYCC